MEKNMEKNVEKNMENIPEVVDVAKDIPIAGDAPNATNSAESAYIQAMCRVQSALPTIVKNNVASFGGDARSVTYKYEDLSSILSEVTPLLTANSLFVRFALEQKTAGSVTVSCIITHEKGHREVTSLTTQLDDSGRKNHAQALGSAVTYLQRYTIKSALGIAASIDTDGHVDRRNADPRVIDPRAIDPRAIDPRVIDPRVIQSVGVGPRSSHGNGPGNVKG